MERRTFLQWLATIPVLGVAVQGDISDYKDSGKVLENLAEEIDQTNLTDGDEVFHLSNNVQRVLQDVEAGISTSETDRARTIASIKHSVAQILAIIPGVDTPPEQPRIETEISAIESVLPYYRTLQTYLHHSDNLYTEISMFEVDVSDPTAKPSLADDELMSLVDDHVFDMKVESKRVQNDAELPVQSLLPDTARVAERSKELVENYETYVTAQQSYFKATAHTTEGAKMREQGDFDNAKTHFRCAKNQPSIDLSESRREYSLDDYSLTLAEYETVISLTQRGAKKMRDSCDSPGSKQSRELFDEGLQGVIDARDAFTPR